MTATAENSRDDATSLEDVPGRHLSLMKAAARLRSGRRRPFPIEAVLLVAGALLLPIGIIAIIVGWYGAAHTFHTYEQNDYLISGGLLGLGLVFVGGFLYFGYWMTRQIRTSSAANQQLLNALGRIEAQLGAGTNGKHTMAPLGVTASPPKGRATRTRSGPATTTAAPEAAPGGAGRQGEAGDATGRGVQTVALVATERGNLLHRPDCPVVANKENLRAVGPDEPGYRPCQICSPFDGT